MLWTTSSGSNMHPFFLWEDNGPIAVPCGTSSVGLSHTENRLQKILAQLKSMAKLSLASVGMRIYSSECSGSRVFYQLQIWLHCFTLVLSLVLFKILKEAVKQSPQAFEPMELLSSCDKVTTCAHRAWFLYRNKRHEGSYWFFLFISLLCSTAVIHIKAYFLTSNIF